MIYTVTLNPAIDETLEVEHLRPGATHRVLSRCRYAGGKGINVARALRVFAEDCVALTIAGGTTGQELAGLLRQEELPCTVYAAPHPTRVNLKISSRGDGLTTELNAPGLLGEAAPAGRLREELLERMEQQANEMKQLRQALDKLKAEASLGEAKQFLASAKTVRGLHVITTTRTGMDVAAMRTMGDFLRDKAPGVVAVIASINGEKVSFLAVCGKEAVARGIKAGDLVRSVSAVCGGKGGGKPDSAMGGGTDVLKVDDALAAVDDFVAANVKE